MAFTAPKLPDELSSRWWQAATATLAKGVADAAAIGKLLDDVASRYRSIEWRNLDLALPRDADGKQIDAAVAVAQRELDRVATLNRAVDAAAKQAGKTAGAWARERPTAATAAAQLAKAAGTFAGELDQLPKMVARQRDEALKAIADDRKRDAGGLRTVDRSLDAIAKAAGRVTREAWPAFFRTVQDMLGSLRAQLKTFPELKGAVDAWKPYAASPPKPRDDRELKKLLDDVTKLAKATGSAIGKLKI